MPFFLRHGVIRHKRRDFRGQNIIIELFQHLQHLSYRFFLWKGFFAFFGQCVSPCPDGSMKREFQKSRNQMRFSCPVVSERGNFQSFLSNRDLTSGEQRDRNFSRAEDF